ncbi:hypothetical protein C362_01006 [Cryptococcus neoformans Bt1]|nr:hypothetical protein C362_01006 [Cryptococcus neoformans var. grubii Bt1]
MLINAYKAAWGVPFELASFEQWLVEVRSKGYRGIEINIHEWPAKDITRLRDLLHATDTPVIIQLFTSWRDYIGPRPEGLGPKEHLAVYKQQVAIAKTFKPVLINVQSGCDIWTIEQSIEFYRETLKIDAALGLEGVVCHETHRNRSCFELHVTSAILQAVPQLKLTGDISHWVLVGERLLSTHPEDRRLLEMVVPHIHHIHCRIGTTQSSQCAEPEHMAYTAEREFFYHFWKQVADYHRKTDDKHELTFVPEYGPFPYHPLFSPRTNSEVADTEATKLKILLSASVVRPFGR